MLLRPCIVGRGYWTRGYFFNISVKQEIPSNLDYGFFSVGKYLFLDEYENKEKIDSNEEFSAEGISEIVLDISSWNLKVMASSDVLADGTVQQKIKFCYKFIGFVDELHITPTKRWTALPTKHCTVCG